ncbi:uncharacterized protein J3R85_015015 [Psidium guajava]|nr:uncharacterized protein J3R85_015015 [Psidium guajava]
MLSIVEVRQRKLNFEAIYILLTSLARCTSKLASWPTQRVKQICRTKPKRDSDTCNNQLQQTH